MSGPVVADWVPIPTPPFAGCVILGMLLNLSGPLFLHLRHRVPPPTGLWCRLNEMKPTDWKALMHSVQHIVLAPLMLADVILSWPKNLFRFLYNVLGIPE